MIVAGGGPAAPSRAPPRPPSHPPTPHPPAPRTPPPLPAPRRTPHAATPPRCGAPHVWEWTNQGTKGPEPSFVPAELRAVATGLDEAHPHPSPREPRSHRAV